MGKSCYGVEILNEPASPIPLVGANLDREHLRLWYQDTMKAAREYGGLDMNKPLMINEWGPQWPLHWKGKFKSYFPENIYGRVEVDVHIYDFHDSIGGEETAWSFFDIPMVSAIAKEVPVFIGEYTLSTNKDLQTGEMQGWALWIENHLR